MKSMKTTALAGSLALAACLLAPPMAAQTTGTGTETGSTAPTQSNTTTSGTNRNDTTSGSMGSVNGTQSTTTGTSSDINRSDTNRATTTTTGTAASDVNRTTGTTTDTDRELPRTASSFPLVAAIGILSLAAAITLRRVSGRHAA